MPASRQPRSRATVADVARDAGVSSAVVSYVINDGPRRVAPATAARVRDSIAALNYRPNESARALRSGSTRVLGLILPETGNPFFGAYADALFRAASNKGLALLTANSAGSVEQEDRLLAQMVQRDVDAILLSSTVAVSDVSAITRVPTRTVLINCPFPVTGVSTVGPASADAADQLTSHLIEVHGHRIIAHIAGDAALTQGEPREAGWRRALQRHHLEPGPFLHAPFTGQGGYEATLAMLQMDNPPTAIFASSDQQALGTLNALQTRGFTVPGEVAVVGIDGTDVSRFAWPPLTVMRQPVQAMADAAVTATLTDDASHRLFPLQLVLRASCGCIQTTSQDRQDPPVHNEPGAN